MAAPAAVQIELRGPVNGMGERDAQGSCFAITMVFPDEEVVRGKISCGELEALHHQSGHLLLLAKAPTDWVPIAKALFQIERDPTIKDQAWFDFQGKAQRIVAAMQNQ